MKYICRQNYIKRLEKYNLLYDYCDPVGFYVVERTLFIRFNAKDK